MAGAWELSLPNLFRAAALVLAFLLLAIKAAPAAELTDSDARLYRSALALARAGDLAAASREAAGTRDQSLALAVEWVALMRGGGGFAEIAAFISAHPDWPGQVKLEERAEAATGDV